jgi:trans-aconitate methyltransferase
LAGPKPAAYKNRLISALREPELTLLSPSPQRSSQSGTPMSRDTDADWKVIGDSEPWYGVLATDRYLKANITPDRVDEFYRSGVDEIGRVVSVLGRHFSPLNLGNALDFGCGVGRLTLAMAGRCGKVWGLDISAGMLEQATRRRDAKRILNVEFVNELPAHGRFDWINSFIVFQHIPPARGYDILDGLFGRVQQHGVVSIQITYYHDARHMTELLRDVAAYSYDGRGIRMLDAHPPRDVGAMSMYDYDLNNVFRLMHRHGLNECFVEQTDHGGCHGVWIYGRRS